MFKLHVYSRSGDIDQQVEVEGDEALIGRSGECHVVIDRKDISRVHARLIAGWVVDDLGSRNGTHVDGRKIADATRVGTRCFEVGDPAGNNLVTIEVLPLPRDGHGQAELTESGAGVPESSEPERRGDRTTDPLPAEPDVAPSDPEHAELEAEAERYRTQCARLEVELEQLREKFEHMRRSAKEGGGGSQADENRSLRERVERLERELRARSPKS